MLSDINRTIEKIHNYIYANDGLDNYEVLEELLKIFYLKTYDEVNDNLLEKSTSDSFGNNSYIFTYGLHGGQGFL